MSDRGIIFDPIRSLAIQFSRRRLLGKVSHLGTAGIVIGSSKLLIAGDGERENGGAASSPSQSHLPLPIPNISPGPKQHVFFPGPVEGAAAPTDPTGPQPNGRDPSTITNFEGLIGQADLGFSGIGTDLDTGAESPYDFNADVRFMHGRFVGADQRERHGTFAFI